MVGYIIVRDREGNPIYITERPVKIDPRELYMSHREPVGSAPQAPKQPTKEVSTRGEVPTHEQVRDRDGR